jgi:formylglycine-generating enzyme required for sulfatase activity
MEFIRVPAGTARIGAEVDDAEAEDNERPAHNVFVERQFWLGITPVTLGQYRRSGAQIPLAEHAAFLDEQAVNYVSWDDASRFVDWLNLFRPSSEHWLHYRLPTEYEWEYACRAGTSTRYYFGNDPINGRLHDYAWFAGNAWDIGNRQPQLVGKKKPNEFGLHDMHGNVWEWTSDGWADYAEILRDGAGIRRCATRVLRGGAFCHEAKYIRSSDRDHYEPAYRHYYTGLRVCLDDKSDENPQRG